MNKKKGVYSRANRVGMYVRNGLGFVLAMTVPPAYHRNKKTSVCGDIHEHILRCPRNPFTCFENDNAARR
jgi:hypothetical protein